MRLRDTFLKPMHPEGWRFVGIFGAVTVVLFLIWHVLGWIGVGLTIWCYYFFRDPKRSVPQGDGLILSPADGVVSLIEPAVPPPELGMGPLPLTVNLTAASVHRKMIPVKTTGAYKPQSAARGGRRQVTTRDFVLPPGSKLQFHLAEPLTL